MYVSPNIERMHKTDMVICLFLAVESELVTVIHHKSPKDKSHSTCSLKAAVWMYWNCNRHSGQDVNKLKTLIE